MNIAILTQPLGKNYGGIMQAYALQKTLRDYGFYPVTINYNYKKPGFIYLGARTLYRLKKKISGTRKSPINIESKYNYLTKGNQEFIHQYITLSEYIDTTKKLKIHFNKNNYNAVIVGSDQTWRPKYSPNIYNFYLEFIKKNKKIKRFAYSSSFGVDSWEYSDKETTKCSKLAKKFNAISVREQSGIELCKNHLGVDAIFTLDPVLLLNKIDYLSLIGERYNNGSAKGVFTYFLDKTAAKASLSKQAASDLNTFTFNTQARYSFGNPNGESLEDYKMPSVLDWLASFANAEFILTDSFHGMLFSIIFEKPFIVVGNKKRGLARFSSLLSELGLIDRLITSNINEIDFSLLVQHEINWNIVRDKLKVHKEFSINYLKSFK